MEAGGSEGALAGTTAIDFSQGVAGPYCTRLLAGLGSEVIKVEKPGQGDSARKVEPFLPGSPQIECSALFHHLNGRKKSITLNLECPEGRNLARRLVHQSRIVVENFTPGTLVSLGLDPASCSEANPGLVLTSISNFGQDGPYREYAATELTNLAMGGLVYTCGEPSREPIAIGGLQASYLAGLNAAVATIGALVQAEVSGQGQWIDISIMESVVSVLEATTVNYSRDEVIQRRQGSRHGRSYPMTILPCEDGYIGIMIATDEDWELFARLFEKEELLEPRFARGEDRLRLADEIESILVPCLMKRTRADVFHWAQGLRLPFSMVLSPEELLSDSQHESRNFFVTTSHPAVGEILQVGGPFKMEATPWQTARAPLLGEHTEQVLKELLSLDEKDIWELRRGGVI